MINKKEAKSRYEYFLDPRQPWQEEEHYLLSHIVLHKGLFYNLKDVYIDNDDEENYCEVSGYVEHKITDKLLCFTTRLEPMHHFLCIYYGDEK